MKWSLGILGALLLTTALVGWWFDDSGSAEHTEKQALSMTLVHAPIRARTKDDTPGANVANSSSSLDGTPAITPRTRSPASASSSAHDCEPTNPSSNDPSKLPNATELDNAQTNDRIVVTTIEPNAHSCETAANLLRNAVIIFDVTSTEAVWYGGPKAYDPSRLVLDPSHRPLNPLMLADRLCSGTQRFDDTTRPKFELIAVTENANAKIYLGENWISDGWTVAPLSEGEYSRVTRLLLGREAQGVGDGANMSRDHFDSAMAKYSFNTKAAAERVQRQRDEELRRVQRRLPDECRN